MESSTLKVALFGFDGSLKKVTSVPDPRLGFCEALNASNAYVKSPEEVLHVKDEFETWAVPIGDDCPEQLTPEQMAELRDGLRKFTEAKVKAMREPTTGEPVCYGVPIDDEVTA
ncbi:MAG: hypothetical protein RIC55_21445 [Pirellulaceae bacterium]